MPRPVSILSLCFVICLIFSGCDPYPDGPNVSFKSRLSRVVNIWEIEFVYDRQTQKDVTEDFVNYVAVIRADGIYEGRTYNALLDTTYVQEGLWDLVNDDMEIRVLFTEPLINPDREFWKILKLKDQEIWFERDQVINGDTTLLEVRMIPGDTIPGN